MRADYNGVDVTGFPPRFSKIDDSTVKIGFETGRGLWTAGLPLLVGDFQERPRRRVSNARSISTNANHPEEKPVVRKKSGVAIKVQRRFWISCSIA